MNCDSIGGGLLLATDRRLLQIDPNDRFFWGGALKPRGVVSIS